MIRALVSVIAFLVFHGVYPQSKWNEEEREVIEAIEGYLAAWNSQNADKLLSYCDTEYDRIDARGNIYASREEILESYTKLFATRPPEGVERKLTYDIFAVRILSPNTAIVDAWYEVKGVGPRPEVTINGMNTVVLVKKNGNWLRVAHRQRIPFDPAWLKD